METKRKDIIADCFKATLITIFLSLVSVALGNAIDGIVVGRFLGEDAMAAFGFTLPYQKLASIPPTVIAIGMRIICVEKLGKGKPDQANGVFSLSVLALMFLSSVFIAATFLFSEQIAGLLGVVENSGAVYQQTLDYLFAYSVGLPAIFLVSILTPIMQLDDDKKRSVIAVTILTVVNTAGDLAVATFLGGGLFGIGIVTTLSYLLATLYLLMHFFRKTANFKFNLWTINPLNLLDMHLYGSSAVVGKLSVMTNINFLNQYTMKYAGVGGVAAFTAVSNVTSLIDSVPKALATSMQMVLGMLIGARDKPAILRLMKLTLKFSTLVALANGLLLILTSPVIAKFYTTSTESETFGMVTDGLFWIAISLSMSFIYTIMQYFYQAFGHFKLMNLLAVANNLAYIMPLGWLLIPELNLTGLWLTLCLNQVVSVLVLIVGIWIYIGKVTFKLEDCLLIPENFDAPEDMQIGCVAISEEEVLAFSEKAQNFCEAQGIGRKTAMYAGIVIEEMARNIIQYGFSEGKQYAVEMRVVIDGEDVVVQIKDDCSPFDPKKRLQLHDLADPTAHIGIKLVASMAKGFDYANVLSLNNLIVRL